MNERSRLIKECIDRAKEYLEEVENLSRKVEAYQVKIVEMALKICDIRHGGISTNIYTIKDYACDIGMHPKTLQNWVSAYRNVAPCIDSKVETSQDWQAVRKTNRDIDKKMSKKDINRIFHQNLINEKPFIGEFRTSRAALKHLKFLLSKRDMRLVKNEQWLELMENLDICSDVINDHLTACKKRGA